MHFSIDLWMQKYQKTVESRFKGRIWFIGLQGSYGRGEATQQSDIDVVLILDQISAEDLQTYSSLLDTLPERDKVCGFVSGKEELLAWEPSDLFQLYYDTTPLVGSLDILLKRIKREDIRRAIRMGACKCTICASTIWCMRKAQKLSKGFTNRLPLPCRPLRFSRRGPMQNKKPPSKHTSGRKTGVYWKPV